MPILSRYWLKAYRSLRRIREKFFLAGCRGGFHSVGVRTSFELPITIWCEAWIAIGEGVHIGPNSWLEVIWRPGRPMREPVITIGRDVSVSGSLFISADVSVIIEDAVLMGRSVHISDHSHRYDQKGIPVKDQGITPAKAVRIGAGAWLGQGVVICPGVTVGKGAVIGANAVVTRDVPPFCVAVGAPARVAKRFGEIPQQKDG